ncbi:MAG: hypothetical protein KKD48_02765 [Nanoarchaeota archaeon]|nr:hypothetical protein [Nanoarchaeota archaeon]
MNMTTVMTVTVAILLLAILFLRERRNKKLLQEQLGFLQRDLKSAYIKFGKSFEHFVPFIKDFPGDREKTVFLGMPIDFISFDNDSVKFTEVKTGSSQLNKNQRRIKQLILDKKVEWHELNYDR